MMVKLIETSEESPAQLVAEHIAALMNPETEASTLTRIALVSCILIDHDSMQVAADQASPSAEAQQLLAQSTALLADEKVAEFIALAVSHMDLVFAKSTAQGQPCIPSRLSLHHTT